MKAAELKERLQLKEPEPTSVLKEAVAEAAKPLETKVAEEADPRHEREWTFNFDWVDGRGKRWQGEFTNKILSIGEQQNAAILQAKLCGGMPFDSIDPQTRNVNHAISHMTYSLQSVPDWAADLRRLEDPGLIVALYMEVASHEAKFFGLT